MTSTSASTRSPSTHFSARAPGERWLWRSPRRRRGGRGRGAPALIEVISSSEKRRSSSAPRISMVGSGWGHLGNAARAWYRKSADFVASVPRMMTFARRPAVDAGIRGFPRGALALPGTAPRAVLDRTEDEDLAGGRPPISRTPPRSGGAGSGNSAGFPASPLLVGEDGPGREEGHVRVRARRGPRRGRSVARCGGAGAGAAAELGKTSALGRSASRGGPPAEPPRMSPTLPAMVSGVACSSRSFAAPRKTTPRGLSGMDVLVEAYQHASRGVAADSAIGDLPLREAPSAAPRLSLAGIRAPPRNASRAVVLCLSRPRTTRAGTPRAR